MSTPETTTWTVHLAARRPGKAVAAGVLILLALFAVAALAPAQWGPGGLAAMLVLAAVLLIGSIAEFLFPVTYTLDADGAHARYWGSHRLLAWGQVRRVYLRADGIKLSPLARLSWMESYRGVVLRTQDRDAVLAQVRAWLASVGNAPPITEDP